MLAFVTNSASMLMTIISVTVNKMLLCEHELWHVSYAGDFVLDFRGHILVHPHRVIRLYQIAHVYICFVLNAGVCPNNRIIIIRKADTRAHPHTHRHCSPPRRRSSPSTDPPRTARRRYMLWVRVPAWSRGCNPAARMHGARSTTTECITQSRGTSGKPQNTAALHARVLGPLTKGSMGWCMVACVGCIGVGFSGGFWNVWGVLQCIVPTGSCPKCIYIAE